MAKPENKPFAHYARYYDLLYQGKDYAAETRFVNQRLKAAGARSGGRLLELGCGTGRHAVALANLGWKVTGVDLSPGMIADARKRTAGLKLRAAARPDFAVGDMRSLRLGQTYDVVTSLFHVVGYQTTNAEFRAAMRTAAVHLRPGGLLFFDFWFGPAVLTERPSVRIKRFADRLLTVTRISEPSTDVARNVVSIDIEVLVEHRRTGKLTRIRENHRVRYFFLPELEHLLAEQGLQVVGHGKWMGREPLDSQSWYGWIAARRTA